MDDSRDDIDVEIEGYFRQLEAYLEDCSHYPAVEVADDFREETLVRLLRALRAC